MKHLKLVLALSLLLVLGAFLVVGCGAEETTTTAAPATTAGPVTTAAPTSETTATTAAPVEPITLVFTIHEPETVDMCTKLLQPWFQRIEEETDGRVKIEAHYNGELVGLMDAYDAVVKGNVDMAFIMDSILPQMVGDNIIDATFVGNKSYRMSRVYNELYQKYPEMQEPYADVKPMLLFCMFPSYIGTNKPIEKVSDFNGLKLIASDAYQSSRVAALGASAVSCLPPDVYSTLERGVADGGTIFGLPQLESNSWGEVVDNITLITTKHPTNGVVMNLDTWNSLPADIQQIIDGMADDIIDLADQVMNAADAAAATSATAKFGTVITEPSEELLADVAELWTPAREAWLDAYEADGFPAHAFYDEMVSLAQKYSAEEYNLNK
jgi:TRAP-type transport system periplasmic protein